MDQFPIILPESTCIYCGHQIKKTRKGKGEHVVHDALGCQETLSNVCGDCNNAFSRIDDELVSRSPLAFIASETLGNKAIDVWDYDQCLDIVLEARIMPGYKSPALWPQVTLFDWKPLMFRADYEELIRVGPENYLKRFHHYLIRARNSLREKRTRRWWWRPVELLPRRGQLPPRIHAKHTFEQLNDKTTFICTYPRNFDTGWILWKLDNWHIGNGRSRTEQSWGVHDPECQASFLPRYIVRALVKTGINLLAWLRREGYFRNTIITKDTFPEAVKFARYDQYWRHAPPEMSSGFVKPKDIDDLSGDATSHRFRLSFISSTQGMSGWWKLDCAFFGGQIGATASFPGLNAEAWNTAIITAPIMHKKTQDKKPWEVQILSVSVVRQMKTYWSNFMEVTPAVPIQNEDALLTLEHRKEK